MLEGKDADKHPAFLEEGVNLPLSTPEIETRSGLDKVPVALLTNTF